MAPGFQPGISQLGRSVVIRNNASPHECPLAAPGALQSATWDRAVSAVHFAGAAVVGPFSDESVSGAAGLDKRPRLLDAIAELGQGDVLLVAKRDRIARDPIVCAMIEAVVSRKGARIVSAAGEGTEGDNPTDVLMRRIVDAFAEYERLLIAARTRAAMQAKARRGERCGTIRFGFDLGADGTKLVANDAEQRAVGIIREMRTPGIRSVRSPRP